MQKKETTERTGIWLHEVAQTDIVGNSSRSTWRNGDNLCHLLLKTAYAANFAPVKQMLAVTVPEASGL